MAVGEAPDTASFEAKVGGKIFVPTEDQELIPAEGDSNVFHIRRHDPAMIKRLQACHDQEMELHRKRFEAGDKSQLLLAIDLCVRTGRAIPEPFATEFCSRIVRWETYQAQTLDEAFTVRRRRSKSAQRRHRSRAGGSIS
jgi:hypothetical protein